MFGFSFFAIRLHGFYFPFFPFRNFVIFLFLEKFLLFAAHSFHIYCSHFLYSSRSLVGAMDSYMKNSSIFFHRYYCSFSKFWFFPFLLFCFTSLWHVLLFISLYLVCAAKKIVSANVPEQFGVPNENCVGSRLKHLINVT